MRNDRITPSGRIQSKFFNGLPWICTSPYHAAAAGSAVSPVGVYVKVDIENAINAIRSQYKGNLEPTPKYLHVLLQNLFQRLLANPAVSGITVGAHWDQVQPRNPTRGTLD